MTQGATFFYNPAKAPLMGLVEKHNKLVEDMKRQDCRQEIILEVQEAIIVSQEALECPEGEKLDFAVFSMENYQIPIGKVRFP